MAYYRRERERQRKVQEATTRLREAQRWNRKASVLLNLDERKVAADLLILLIGHLSRERHAVNWSPEIVLQLWEAAIGVSDKFKTEGEQARYLSEKCQGWAVWDEAAGKPRIITLGEWEGIYYKRLAKQIEEKFSE